MSLLCPFVTQKIVVEYLILGGHRVLTGVPLASALGRELRNPLVGTPWGGRKRWSSALSHKFK